MSQRISKLKTWSAAVLLGMTAAIPAQADDTEIYTGLNSAANGAVDPNVLFILDTSGSMGQLGKRPRTLPPSTRARI